MAIPYPTATPLTNNPNLVVNAFRFVSGADSAVGTITQNHGAEVASIATDNAGKFTVTLAKPWPAAILACHVSLAGVAITSLLGRACYKAGSYDATAGTFVINHSAPTDDTHATTQIAADPVTNTEFHVSYFATHDYATVGDA